MPSHVDRKGLNLAHSTCPMSGETGPPNPKDTISAEGEVVGLHAGRALCVNLDLDSS
jgi:hypothetical protein